MARMADLDPAEYRKRVIVKALASPVVYLPAGVGALTAVTAGVAGLAFFTFLGVTGVVFAVGAAVTRLLWRTNELGEAVAADAAGEAEAAQRAALDGLARRAEVYGDREVAGHVYQLRQLGGRLDKAEQWGRSAAVGLEVAVDVLGKAEQLYQSCLASLDRSLALRTAAAEMATDEGRRRVLDSRQKLLDEVQSGIGRIGLALDRLQAASLTRDAEGDLPRLRDELDAGLQIARRVEQRMGELERSLEPEEPKLAGPRDFRE